LIERSVDPSYTIHPNFNRHSDDTTSLTAYFSLLPRRKWSTRTNFQTTVSPYTTSCLRGLLPSGCSSSSLGLAHLVRGVVCSRSAPVYSSSSLLNALHYDRFISVSPAASPTQGQRVRLFTQLFESPLCDLQQVHLQPLLQLVVSVEQPRPTPRSTRKPRRRSWHTNHTG